MPISGALLAADALLLAVHVMYRVEGAQGDDGVPRWTPTRFAWRSGGDGSLIEGFGHLQLSAAAGLLLFTAAWLPRHGVLAAWGYSFVILVADDVFMLHEQVGLRLGLDRLHPALTDATAQEIGGLIFWVLVAVPLCATLTITHRRSSPAARHGSWRLLFLSTPLMVVGAGYVLVGAVSPAFLEGASGQVLTVGRTSLKLLTMSVLLLQALHLSTAVCRSSVRD